MQGWTDISVARLAMVHLYSIKKELKQENISLKQHFTAFAQVSALLHFEVTQITFWLK